MFMLSKLPIMVLLLLALMPDVIAGAIACAIPDAVAEIAVAVPQKFPKEGFAVAFTHALRGKVKVTLL